MLPAFSRKKEDSKYIFMTQLNFVSLNLREREKKNNCVQFRKVLNLIFELCSALVYSTHKVTFLYLYFIQFF